MKRKFYIYALLALAVFSGCRKQIVPDDVPVLPEESQEMVINVKSDVPDPKFTFLFWHQEDFVRGLKNENQGFAQPYHIAEPTGNIGDYEYKAGTTEATSQDNDYNTGRVYPENYGVAVCTGYGPYTGVTPSKDNSGMTDYSTLDIANPGTTDVLVAQNFLEGSSLFPFSGNLKFFHPQIQLTVYAKLASTMTKYIKGVSFSIGKDNLLSSLEWNGDRKQYMPSKERPDKDWDSKVLAEQINSSDNKSIGVVHVIPSSSDPEWTMKSIDITIKGMIGNTTDGSYSDFTMTVPAIFKDDGGNDLILGLNDSYEIYLIFDEDQIEITAVKVPWVDGGNILVPVHPIPPDSTGT